MFTLAVLIGIFSYLIFGLGLLGLLSPGCIWVITLGYAAMCILIVKIPFLRLKPTKMGGILIGLLGLQAVVNLIGALGPELGFDALWYHLTIPKIWLAAHKIFFIPDGRYYYSVIPKIVEMTYIIPMSIGWDIGPKIIHWGFGLLALVGIYKLSRKWLSQEYSILAGVIFYANLVVGWQSITAYVDLGRTFFEITALYLLISKSIYKSALVLGLAISTKLIAIGSLPIFLFLLILEKYPYKTLFKFTVLTLLIPLPWFVFAYIATGNPVYPVFSGYDLSSVRHWSDAITIFFRSADPLTPVYIMMLPLVIYYWKKLPREITFYCLLALGVWFVTPRTGGGRFILPYLPAFSVLSALIIKQITNQAIKKVAIIFVMLISVVSIGYRAVANWKFIPVVTGRQSTQEFLDKNLDKQFGNNYFYLPDSLSK